MNTRILKSVVFLSGQLSSSHPEDIDSGPISMTGLPAKELVYVRKTRVWKAASLHFCFSLKPPYYLNALSVFEKQPARLVW